MWAKLCLYYRFALKIPNSEPIPEYSVEFFFFLFYFFFFQNSPPEPTAIVLLPRRGGIQSCVWHITPVMSRQSA